MCRYLFFQFIKLNCVCFPPVILSVEVKLLLIGFLLLFIYFEDILYLILFIQLAEVFAQEIDPVMRSLGYCCGQKYVFQPQDLCCYGKDLCIIPRDTKYWSYQNKYVLSIE